MLPFGYNPQNYGGKVWWNENDPEMCAIWGTQADYDRHIQQGGTWGEYVSLARLRMVALEKQDVKIDDTKIKPLVTEGDQFLEFLDNLGRFSMFGSNDKITLNLINAKDIEGKIIPLSLKLPLNDKDYSFPEELASIDVFEYHEGIESSTGAVSFHIYIGEEAPIKEFVTEFNGRIVIRKNLEIPSLESPVCFRTVSGTRFIFAVLNEGDIVVNNQDQLKNVIGKISEEYSTICSSIKKIRSLSTKK